MSAIGTDVRRSMKFVLEIEMTSSAFNEDASGELVRVLRIAAEGCEQGFTSMGLSDSNGQHVGEMWFETVDQSG